MKYTLYFIALCISISSCGTSEVADTIQHSERTLNPKDIVLKNDTILISKEEDLIKREGDSLSGRLYIQSYYQQKVIDYHDGWVTSYKIFTGDSVLTRHYNYVKGKLDGSYQKWYENGVLQTSGFYTMNMADSTWNYYYQNGNLDTRGQYDSKYKIKDFQNSYKMYDPETGESIEAIARYKLHSAPHGTWEFYSFSGQLIKTMKFDKGTIVAMEFGSAEE